MNNNVVLIYAQYVINENETPAKTVLNILEIET